MIKSVLPANHGDQHLPTGSDPIPGLTIGGGGTFDAIWGQLYNDANIIAGTGFTAEWNDEDLSSPSLNLITVRFDTPFADPPTVLLTANNNNPADVTGEYAVSLKTRDTGFIVVEGKEFDGTAEIGGFDFIAIATAALS